MLGEFLSGEQNRKTFRIVFAITILLIVAGLLIAIIK